MSGSRLPGFYKLSVAERRALVAERSGVDPQALASALDGGGIDCATADKLVENVLGTYALPFGVALNVQVNGTDRLVPMVVEEPSVIAAASNAARMVRSAGGFTAEMTEALMIAQIELRGLADVELALRLLANETEHLLTVARGAVPNLIERGGGPRSIELRRLEKGRIVVHVLVDCRDAMGANLVNSIAEAVGPVAAGITGAELGLRILSNLSDRRAARVTCRVHPTDLVLSRAKPTFGVGDSAPPSGPSAALTGDAIADGIVAASEFAEADPYRAATHNKGIMNGIDAVVIATGNDFRAVEAGAHAYAALSGRYRPLSVWRRDGEALVGELTLPLALGIVGGTLRVHPAARLALSLVRVDSADELALVAASVGLASNLAALRALATEGIQRGHMSLHARSVAVAAGAQGSEVELVAGRLSEDGSVTLEAARRALSALRGT
ncbi:MAG: Hydroxymethylglutaryl-CoA reductase [Polyangiaceae bacterium]|jgi:hydroxymethylglutaryl-CoA reductase|nr:Hydroxymethylglutaryl-CoA reductase [Polyangiaceae bacterium]